MTQIEQIITDSWLHKLIHPSVKNCFTQQIPPSFDQPKSIAHTCALCIGGNDWFALWMVNVVGGVKFNDRTPIELSIKEIFRLIKNPQMSWGQFCVD